MPNILIQLVLPWMHSQLNWDRQAIRLQLGAFFFKNPQRVQPNR